MRGAPVKAGLLVVLVILLTVVTQIGGAVLWLCVPAFRWLDNRLAGRRRPLRAGAFAALLAIAYLGASLAAVPLAGLFGRVPLACGLTGAADYGPRTIWTCLLNRHYATLPARQALQRVSAELSADINGSGITYLDAGFPFFERFPMIPHLSHGDGWKIDLALIFQDLPATPSPVGYWGFVQPHPNDPRPCAGQEGWLRWNMAWLRPLIPEVALDDRRTARLIQALTRSSDVRRILIETHLRRRLDLNHPKIRFQGCRAARHDDHIHVEFTAN